MSRYRKQVKPRRVGHFCYSVALLAKPNSMRNGVHAEIAESAAHMWTINRITGRILNAALHIHSDLGPGLFESVYEMLLAYELEQEGLAVERQKVIGIRYKSLEIKNAFKADLLIEGCVLVEIKSVPELALVHYKQVLSYLRLMDLRMGILINFGQGKLKDGFKRIANSAR